MTNTFAFRLLIMCCTVCTVSSLSAQDLTSPLISNSWQATFSNPALYGRLDGRLTLGLPGAGNDFAVENVTYGDLLTDSGNALDLAGIVPLLDERNEVRNDLAIETLGVGLRGDRLSFGLSHRLRAGGELDYPKTLIQLVAEGNAQFIGQTVEIAPQGYVSSFHELGLGASYAVTEKILFGARIKYLSGVADVRTAPGASLRFTTGEENYALTLEQDLTVNSAGVLDYDGAEDVDFAFNLNGLRSDALFAGSNGLAFDLGLFVDLDRVRLQASALDLGGTINWEEQVTNLTFSGTDAFSGLDVLEQFFEDSVSFDGAVDSLRIEFEPVEDNQGYGTSLPATYLVGGEYEVTDRLTAGLLVAYYDRPRAAETAIALSARYRIIDQLTAGLVYNARRGAAANLGANLFVDVGPVQLLLATDNLLTVFRQNDSTRAGFRVGAALSFGKPPRADREN